MAYFPTLVDYFVEVSIVDTEHTSVRAIRHRTPATDRDHFALPDGVRYFCLPDKLNLRPRATYERVPSFHSFTLTGGDGSRAFGFALTTYDQDDDACLGGHSGIAVPHVYCFISHFPFFSLFKQILGWIHHHRQDDDDFSTGGDSLRRCILPSRDNNQEDATAAVPWLNMIDDFVRNSPAPHGGSVLDIHFGRDFVYAHTLLKSALPHVDDMCFQLLFQHLSVKNIMLVLNCMLLEQRILIHSSHHGLLTPVCEALCALLYPFVWEHVYIPMLPMKLIDYLQAPVPFFMGVHTSYLTTKIGADTFASCVVIHLDKDKVVRPIHATLPDWTGQDQPQIEDHHLPKFPLSPLATLVTTVKNVLDQYQPPTNPHTAATNRIRLRRKARTSDALTILRGTCSPSSLELDQDTPTPPPYAAPEVEITFGHGPLGITFESSRVWLLATGLADDPTTPSCAASAVVKAFPQLQNGLPGPAALSGLIAPGSYLLSVNDHSTLHLSFEATCELLRHESRPLVLRFQNATQLPYHNAMQFAARVRASSLVALPPNVPRPVQCLDHVEWVDAIRTAFATFFASQFPDILPFVTLQPALAASQKGQIARRHSVQRFVSFDREAFLRTRRRLSLAYFAAVVDTQAFAAFVNDTAVGQSPHLGFESPFVDLFHECVQLMDVPGAIHARLARGGDGTKRVLLQCQGIPTTKLHPVGYQRDEVKCQGNRSSPRAPEVTTTTTTSAMSKLFHDLELEINSPDVAEDEPVILVETPQKRKSITRQLEMMICGAAIELPTDEWGNGRRRRSLSDSSMLQLEEELLRPLDIDSAAAHGRRSPVKTDQHPLALDTKAPSQPQDDGAVKRKLKKVPRPKLSSDKLWAAWRRKTKA